MAGWQEKPSSHYNKEHKKFMHQIYAKSRSEWRDWLKNNHERNTGIWLVFYKKKTNEPTLEYDEAVEESLCFGWIDSTIKKLDEKKYVRKFTPCTLKSHWSETNKKRVEKIIHLRLMTPAGLEKITHAKSSGMWEKPDRPEISKTPSPEFLHALNNNRSAKSFFQQLAPSYQKQFIEWIATAKQPETITQRIMESVSLLEKGEKLGMK